MIKIEGDGGGDADCRLEGMGTSVVACGDAQQKPRQRMKAQDVIFCKAYEKRQIRQCRHANGERAMEELGEFIKKAISIVCLVLGLFMVGLPSLCVILVAYAPFDPWHWQGALISSLPFLSFGALAVWIGIRGLSEKVSMDELREIIRKVLSVMFLGLGLLMVGFPSLCVISIAADWRGALNLSAPFILFGAFAVWLGKRGLTEE